MALSIHPKRILFGVVIIAIAASAGGSHARPNVVVFLADDQGWGDLSLHGNRDLSTPNIDSLARSGASFDRFYVCPVCAPTRAEFLTGKYHPRSGVRGVTVGRERMNLGHTTIADAFQQAGYATAAFGKWHNGTQPPYHPNGRGFSDFYGFCSGHWGHYFSPLLERNGLLVRGEGYLTDDFTDQAIRFIKQNAEEPLFAFLPYCTPHSPMQVPDRWWRRFEERPLTMPNRFADREDEQHTRAALAMCENIDWNVGRVLDEIKRLEIDDKTIIVYFSDNGPNGYRWNGEMRGIKGSTDEGGVRSPLFIRWPAAIPAGRRVKSISGAIDLLPTLAELAGIDIARLGPLDGRSLVPLLASDGTGERWPNRQIYSHWGGRVSVRTERYRLDHTGRLYDMVEDPEQRRDVSEDAPETASRLRQDVDDWKREMLTPLSTDTRPFTVGHPGSVTTLLPARDATIHGQIKRSSQHPNCSFLTNWSSEDDRITWPIDVLTAGEYQVDLYYTCSQSQIGSTFALNFGEGEVSGRVAVAHDPPLVGAEQDRVPRSESYVKDFRPLRVENLRLESGVGDLTLRAIRIANEQVLDLRLLRLTRVE